ncbi:MAG: DUF952 domain-containing protein [Anaerolineales bacterium]|nr:DUF952 domain-containing protein [Chloroflexota bacterium]MBL6979817.1 DUF952 domain-containing protein [Anaerolineales bacterium]
MRDARECIVHICTQSDWENAQSSCEYRAASLETEGFIHCSRQEQVLTVANRFYGNIPGLVLLWIDPQRVGVEIRWEPADGDVFPHVYGPIEVGAVEAVKNLDPDPDGVFRKLPTL